MVERWTCCIAWLGSTNCTTSGSWDSALDKVPVPLFARHPSKYSFPITGGVQFIGAAHMHIQVIISSWLRSRPWWSIRHSGRLKLDAQVEGKTLW